MFNQKLKNEEKECTGTTIPKIDYAELTEGTNNWSDRLILGKGGFGTVFRGIWKHTDVAIKRIERRGDQTEESNQIQIQQSLAELRYLNACRHDNILQLYGYSMNGNEPCLVYELMVGTLEQRMRPNSKRPSLSWHQRINILTGTAK